MTQFIINGNAIKQDEAKIYLSAFSKAKEY